MESVCMEVKETDSKIKFGPFRMQVFSTHAPIGCGLTKQGVNLWQLFLPSRGFSSYNHLVNGCGDRMSAQQAESLVDGSDERKRQKQIHNDGTNGKKIELADFDKSMRIISQHLGQREYYRDTTECGICKSNHSRELFKKDVLPKGVSLHNIIEGGLVVAKKHGIHQQWEQVLEVLRRFRFIQQRLQH